MPSGQKSVLITGCTAGGIGGALAEVFHEKNYHVFATAPELSKVSQILSSASNVTVLKLDVLSKESIDNAVKEVTKATGGRLDVLVNNSGRGMIAPGLDTPVEEGRKLFDLNFWAPFAMVQAFAPLLIEAQGCLVNSASASAVAPFPLQSMYNASKAALAAASETWRLELQPLGVRIITTMPTGVKTNFFGSEISLPEITETSPYFPIRKFIYEQGDGRLQAKAISAKQCASQIYRAVENGSIGPVWVGTDALMARLTFWLSPRSILDIIIESIVPFSKEMSKARQSTEISVDDAPKRE